MFMRFSLFPGGPNMNPVLAFCNMYSKVFFWDLSRLEFYHDASKNVNGADLKDNRPAFLNVFQHRNRGGGLMARVQRGVSPTESSSSFNTGSSDVQDREKENKGKVDWDRSMKNWTKKYEMDTPLVNIVAHKEEVVKGFTFTGRYITWSRDGQWCVVVGSSGVFAVLQRWGQR
jgi:polycomb protein EED